MYTTSFTDPMNFNRRLPRSDSIATGLPSLLKHLNDGDFIIVILNYYAS